MKTISNVDNAQIFINTGLMEYQNGEIQNGMKNMLKASEILQGDKNDIENDIKELVNLAKVALACEAQTPVSDIRTYY